MARHLWLYGLRLSQELRRPAPHTVFRFLNQFFSTLLIENIVKKAGRKRETLIRPPGSLVTAAVRPSFGYLSLCWQLSSQSIDKWNFYSVLSPMTD